MLLKVMDVINDELDKLCRRGKDNESPSCFRHVPVTDLEEFDFKKCMSELQNKCPFWYRLITTLVQRNDHRNKNKTR